MSFLAVMASFYFLAVFSRSHVHTVFLSRSFPPVFLFAVCHVAVSFLTALVAVAVDPHHVGLLSAGVS